MAKHSSLGATILRGKGMHVWHSVEPGMYVLKACTFYYSYMIIHVY